MHMKLVPNHPVRVSLPRIVYGSHKKESDHEYHHRDHGMREALADVHECMAVPPRTWAEHYGKPGGMIAIVEMEYKELMENKAKGSKDGIETELAELAAACLCALADLNSK